MWCGGKHILHHQQDSNQRQIMQFCWVEQLSQKQSQLSTASRNESQHL